MKLYDKRDYFNFPIVNFPYLFVGTFLKHLHMDYISLCWYDIPEFVVPFMISTKEDYY